MFSKSNRSDLFNQWASQYDQMVHADPTGFPFAGYEQVLDEVVRCATPAAGMSILDLGTGTGNLGQHFAELGCDVWGFDFSAEMLAKAREKLPTAHFVQANLEQLEWPIELPDCFDRIVSAYVFHEFDPSQKIQLVERWMPHLVEGGSMVIGDIAFPHALAFETAHRQWEHYWDEDEYYWVAEDALCLFQQAGLTALYIQVSSCGGVFVIRHYKPSEYSVS